MSLSAPVRAPRVYAAGVWWPGERIEAIASCWHAAIGDRLDGDSRPCAAAIPLTPEGVALVVALSARAAPFAVLGEDPRMWPAGAPVFHGMVDGPFGREAFSIDVPGGRLSVRGGWLALRRQTGAAVLPVLVHGEGRRMVIEIHPPLPRSEADPVRDAAACRDVLTPLLASYVRNYPEQCRYLAYPPWR